MQNLLKKIKKEWLKTPIKKRIINIFVFWTIITVALLIDQLTKTQIFTNEEFKLGFLKENVHNYGIIGFRPVFHNGVTSGLHKFIGINGIHFLSFLFMIILLFLSFWSEKIIFIITYAICFSGVLGNTIDRIAYVDYGVKDLIFLPWFDTGTFNFADIFIAVSIILVIVATILANVNFKNKKNNIQDDNSEKK
ncbi:signal peptidase II [Mesomycoplasma neurolyticum]|uniref:Lipoprotein signal peptidase n=1 Tax=Mesomycoplasma neurolyticum TaxID=2120 RepID=A0A449A603_9BACT|nr:signal peptidase II [Mesomycoplasma neurolyticum]VEU59685.1 lipoprotein signal peptidase [Mesomycoplasma neurolyticum]